jgi:hypothetical protein
MEAGYPTDLPFVLNDCFAKLLFQTDNIPIGLISDLKSKIFIFILPSLSLPQISGQPWVLEVSNLYW